LSDDTRIPVLCPIAYTKTVFIGAVSGVHCCFDSCSLGAHSNAGALLWPELQLSQNANAFIAATGKDPGAFRLNYTDYDANFHTL